MLLVENGNCFCADTGWTCDVGNQYLVKKELGNNFSAYILQNATESYLISVSGSSALDVVCDIPGQDVCTIASEGEILPVEAHELRVSKSVAKTVPAFRW